MYRREIKIELKIILCLGVLLFSSLLLSGNLFGELLSERLPWVSYLSFIFLGWLWSRGFGFPRVHKADKRDRQDENAWRARAELLEAAMESMSESVFITDAEGNYLFSNNAFATVHKFKSKTDAQQMLGRYPKLFEVYKTEGTIVAPENWCISRAVRGESTRGAEYRMRRTDIDATWIGLYDGAPIFGKTGKRLGALVVARDISERKELEESLSRSERDFRLLAESMPQIVWITDAAGKNTYFNHQWVDFTGLTLEESYGDGWNTPFHPDDRQMAWEAWQNAVTKNDVYILECRLRRADGEYFWWLIKGVPSLDACGNIVNWYGTCTYIDDMKIAKEKLLQNHERLQHTVAQLAQTKMELEKAYLEVEAKVAERTAELVESEARHRLIIETMVQGVIIHDQNACIISINTAAQNILGMDERCRNNGVLLPDGMTFVREDGTILAQEDQPSLLALSTALTVGPIVLGFWSPRDKSQRWISISAVPTMAVKTNKIERVYTIFEDITERQLAKIHLIEARSADQRLARSKAEFLANMSHEIRTPMNGIIGLAKIILNKETSEEVRRYIEKILSCSQSLLGILNDILDLAKLDASRMKIECIPFSLHLVLENIRNLFEDHAHAKSLRILIELAGHVPSTPKGDALRLQQILSNLVGNALKFTEHGHVLVKIDFRPVSATSGIFIFAVEDTGIGIRASDLDKLFQAFSQVDESITRRFGGTGLGLVISQNLLRLMGGTFKVNSELGRGSEFSFELPLDFVPDVEMLNVRNATTPTGAGFLAGDLKQKSAKLQGARILVAEDDAVNQLVIRAYFDLIGVDITIADNGQQVLDFLEKQAFDIVLMDVRMPIMGGLTATQIIRSHPAYAQLPIIAMTAGITLEERDSCRKSGMDDLIAKPVDPHLLMATLNYYLGRPAQVRADELRDFH